MCEDKKPILFDDIEWGNQELPHISHDEIMDEKWKFLHQGKQQRKKWGKYLTAQNKKRGTKCIVIDPNGKEYKFDTIGEASRDLNHPMLLNDPNKWFPYDGSEYIGQRRRFRHWRFRRIV